MNKHSGEDARVPASETLALLAQCGVDVRKGRSMAFVDTTSKNMPKVAKK